MEMRKATNRGKIIRQLKKGRERERERSRKRGGKGGRRASERQRWEKVRSHAAGMLEGGIVGVTAPFFTAIIRASCQRERAAIGWRSREGGRVVRGGVGGEELIEGEIIPPCPPSHIPFLPSSLPPALPHLVCQRVLVV